MSDINKFYTSHGKPLYPDGYVPFTQELVNRLGAGSQIQLWSGEIYTIQWIGEHSGKCRPPRLFAVDANGENLHWYNQPVKVMEGTQ